MAGNNIATGARPGRPKRGEIRRELMDLSPEEQMRRDAVIRELAPDDGYEPFTYDLLHRIGRKPDRERRALLASLGKIEWQRCADDVFYWLDNKRHPIPYVHTLDARPMYVCKECVKRDPELRDMTWGQFHTKVHLETVHNVMTGGLDMKDILAWYDMIPTTRPWTMKPYFEPIVTAWLNNPVMVVEKSRDMMATWLFVVLFTWDTLYHEGRQNVFQSDDTEKTRELVQKRAFFIFEKQPRFLRNVHPAKFEVGISKGGRMFVPSLNSEIIGLAQGPDQIRYLHPAGVFVDEAAFHSQLEDTFGAVKPAIEKGGRITLVSSANPGYFQALAQDFSDR